MGRKGIYHRREEPKFSPAKWLIHLTCFINKSRKVHNSYCKNCVNSTFRRTKVQHQVARYAKCMKFFMKKNRGQMPKKITDKINE
jgi:hypothetical protein